jgi:hypothetical protein
MSKMLFRAAPAVGRLARQAPACSRPVMALASRAFAQPQRRVNGIRSASTSIVVEPNELDILFPRESPENGFSYDLNWSLCKTGIVPQGKAFRNLKVAELQKAGGAANTDAPKVIPWDAAFENELKSHLGSAKTTCYVQDCALGAITANEVQARIVTDSAAAAVAFYTLCSRTKAVPVHKQELDVVVIHASALGSRGPVISINPKTKEILMAGTINAAALVQMMEEASNDAFLSKGVLPLWGPGDENNETVYMQSGFDAGASKVKHGFAYSRAGFCRLFMGSVSMSDT